ncbi:MAG: hypothetical protein OES38_17655, partial [Gammaproteobacteria bacterium]|nr:hypothetical protein [Gammaproteobacteria bacterium]
LQLEELHRTLLGELIAVNRINDAFSYVAALDLSQAGPDLYLQFGRQLQTEDNLSRKLVAALPPQQQAQLRMGVATSLITQQATGKARRVYEKIDESEAPAAAVEVIRLLILESNWRAMNETLALAKLDEDTKSALIMQATDRAARIGATTELSKLAGIASSDASRAQLAGAFAYSGDVDRAGQIFDRAKEREARTWEQVALRTARYEWLEAYYLALPDPWRRSERLYQWAKQRLAAGEADEANRLATLSEVAAREIPSTQTRALAHRLLSEYYALAADPEAATRMAEQIPAGTDTQKEQMKAQAQVAVAWAVAGQPTRAAEKAARISEIDARIAALVMVAQHVHGYDADAYDELVAQARRECLSLASDQKRAGESAWLLLLKTQLGAGDVFGATETSKQASAAGFAPAVYEVMADYQIVAGNFEEAILAARAVTAGADDTAGYGRQQHALGKIVLALADSGDGLRAAQLLARIDQESVRELNTAPVVRALVQQGETGRATELVKQLKRSDALHASMLEVLKTVAERRELPEAELLNEIPRRSGGDLCWAVAASAEVKQTELDGWLSRLNVVGCRAFAYAGAAYALMAPAEQVLPARLFALVDPSSNEERMALAMQRMAGGRRGR